MVEQRQILRENFFCISSQTSEEKLSFVMLLIASRNQVVVARYSKNLTSAVLVQKFSA